MDLSSFLMTDQKHFDLLLTGNWSEFSFFGCKGEFLSRPDIPEVTGFGTYVLS